MQKVKIKNYLVQQLLLKTKMMTVNQMI